MKISILTSPEISSNTLALLFPILKIENILRKKKIFINIESKINIDLLKSDLVIIDSKFHKNLWEINCNKIFEELKILKDSVGRIFYYDTTDSTGCIQKEIFPYIDKYLKSQILLKSSLYKNRYYGQRIFSDYYHKNFNVVDQKAIYSTSLTDSEIKKIDLGWNSSICNYSFLGKIFNFIFSKTRIKKFLISPFPYISPNKKRKSNFNYRMSAAYPKNTISFQRKFVLEKMSKIKKRVGFPKYINELKKTKILISPFGWGEICYRDFESFIYGNLLFKPNMNHLSTWPKLYLENETYIPFNWSMRDFEKKLFNTLENYQNYKFIAENAQKNYMSIFKTLDLKFTNHFLKIIEDF